MKWNRVVRDVSKNKIYYWQKTCIFRYCHQVQCQYLIFNKLFTRFFNWFQLEILKKGLFDKYLILPHNELILPEQHLKATLNLPKQTASHSSPKGGLWVAGFSSRLYNTEEKTHARTAPFISRFLLKHTAKTDKLIFYWGSRLFVLKGGRNLASEVDQVLESRL